jgi:RNA polymerase sigma factor (sigma-70 family)
MSAILDQDVAAFETHRRALMGLVYRMLGSRAEAEDIVQDAYLRWHAANRKAIDNPRRYLGTVVTRLCLDRMKSAQARREQYVGQWLPEPVVDELFEDEHAGELAHDISVALMLLLERLSPLERASFLLHDVFGLDFTEIGRALGRGEAACRQLAARARAHIEAGRPRFPTSREEGHPPRPFRLQLHQAIRKPLLRLWPRMPSCTRMEVANVLRPSTRFAAPTGFYASLSALRARTQRLPPLRPGLPWSTVLRASSCARTMDRSIR